MNCPGLGGEHLVGGFAQDDQRAEAAVASRGEQGAGPHADPAALLPSGRKSAVWLAEGPFQQRGEGAGRRSSTGHSVGRLPTRAAGRPTAAGRPFGVGEQP